MQFWPECNRVKASVLQRVHYVDFSHVSLTLVHSERPRLYAILAFLSAVGLKGIGHAGYT